MSNLNRIRIAVGLTLLGLTALVLWVIGVKRSGILIGLPYLLWLAWGLDRLVQALVSRPLPCSDLLSQAQALGAAVGYTVSRRGDAFVVDLPQRPYGFSYAATARGVRHIADVVARELDLRAQESEEAELNKGERAPDLTNPLALALACVRLEAAGDTPSDGAALRRADLILSLTLCAADKLTDGRDAQQVMRLWLEHEAGEHQDDKVPDCDACRRELRAAGRDHNNDNQEHSHV